MTLTMVVNIEHSNVTLKEQHSLVIGNLYDPLRLEFSSGYSPTFQKLKVKLYRPDTGELIAYTTEEFVRDPDTPAIGVGRLNLATTDIKEWAETLGTDSDPATETNGSVQVVVCEVWDDDGNSIVYANCEVPITLAKGVAVPLSGDGDFATREYVASQIKQAFEEWDSKDPSDGPDEPADPTGSFLVRGRVTSSVNQKIQFTVDGTNTVVGSGENAPDPACIYYDTGTRIIYSASSDGDALQAIGTRLLRDVILNPRGETPYSLFDTGTDSPTIDFVGKTLKFGYYDPENDSFSTTDSGSNSDQIKGVEHILYVDLATGQLFYYDGKAGSSTRHYHPIAADIDAATLQKLVSGVTFNDSWGFDSDKHEYTFPVSSEPDTGSGGKHLNVGGMLGYAVAVGEFDSEGRFHSALGSEKSREIDGDPRRLYVAKAGENPGVYWFDHVARKFNKCANATADLGNVVRGIRHANSTVLPDDDGIVDLDSITPKQIVYGELVNTSTGEYFAAQGEGGQDYNIHRGDPQTLYVDTSKNLLYRWNSDAFVQIDLLSSVNCVTSVRLNDSSISPTDGVVDLGNLLTAAVAFGSRSRYENAFIEGTTTADKNPGKLYIDADLNTIYKYDKESDKYVPVVSPRGQENAIEQIKVNGEVVEPDEDKCVNIEPVLTTAIVRGTIQGDKAFKIEGNSVATSGSPEYLYVDSNTNQTYIYNGRFVRVAKPEITSIKVNGSAVKPDTDHTADLGTVLKRLNINGVEAVVSADGAVNVDIADPGDVRVQTVRYGSFQSDSNAYHVSLTKDDVHSGASIVVFNYANRSGSVTLDVTELKTLITSQRMAFSFEVWLRNSASDTIQITRPTTAISDRSNDRIVAVNWLNGDEVIELEGGRAVFMAFRVAPGWTQDANAPLVQASIYHIG